MIETQTISHFAQMGELPPKYFFLTPSWSFIHLFNGHQLSTLLHFRTVNKVTKGCNHLCKSNMFIELSRGAQRFSLFYFLQGSFKPTLLPILLCP